MARAHTLLMLVLGIVGCLMTASRAHLGIHIVGASYGWKIPPNDTFYEEWAKTKTFFVGDKLVFLYRPGLQNVVQATQEENFKYCQQNNVIDIFFAGPTTVELTEPGTQYFYCTIGLHCEHGQRLRINVQDKNNSSSSTTTTTH